MKLSYLSCLIFGVYCFAQLDGNASQAYNSLLATDPHNINIEKVYWMAWIFRSISCVFVIAIFHYDHITKKKVFGRIDKLQEDIGKAHFLAYNRAMEPD